MINDKLKIGTKKRLSVTWPIWRNTLFFPSWRKRGNRVSEKPPRQLRSWDLFMKSSQYSYCHLYKPSSILVFLWYQWFDFLHHTTFKNRCHVEQPVAFWCAWRTVVETVVFFFSVQCFVLLKGCCFSFLFKFIFRNVTSHQTFALTLVAFYESRPKN